MSDRSSPLTTSLGQSSRLLVGLLCALAGILGVGTVLIWTRDEQAGARERGFLMLGLCAFVLVIAGVLHWRAKRRARRAAEADDSAEAAGPPPSKWQRTGLGPAWLDWFALLLPAVLFGLPLVLLAANKDAETFLGAAVVVGFFDLVMLPAILARRREPVALELVPEGLVVRTRNGKARTIERGELRSVTLDIERLRSFSVGHLRLAVSGDMTISLREPMNRPLAQIADAVAAHMGVGTDSRFPAT